MLLDVVIVIFGFVGLIWGADKFVAGASAIAFNFGVAPLMIGLTIVAFGTSAPEFFSSAVAAIENQAPIAIGNALGSNIFNIGVALGIAALIRPITPPNSLVRRELPALLIVTVVTGIVFSNLYIGIIDSLVLIALLALCALALVRRGLRGEPAPDLAEIEEDTDIPAISTTRASLRLSIGLTIVALGTSLPELAACVASVLRGHSDLALGNIVGSNILNLLVVLPFPGLLAAGPIEQELFYRDYATMLAMTVVLAGTCLWTIKSGKTIGRSFGFVFLLMYAAWFSIMYQQI